MFQHDLRPDGWLSGYNLQWIADHQSAKLDTALRCRQDQLALPRQGSSGGQVVHLYSDTARHLTDAYPRPQGLCHKPRLYLIGPSARMPGPTANRPYRENLRCSLHGECPSRSNLNEPCPDQDRQGNVGPEHRLRLSSQKRRYKKRRIAPIVGLWGFYICIGANISILRVRLGFYRQLFPSLLQHNN